MQFMDKHVDKHIDNQSDINRQTHRQTGTDIVGQFREVGQLRYCNLLTGKRCDWS